MRRQAWRRGRATRITHPQDGAPKLPVIAAFCGRRRGSGVTAPASRGRRYAAANLGRCGTREFESEGREVAHASGGSCASLPRPWQFGRVVRAREGVSHARHVRETRAYGVKGLLGRGTNPRIGRTKVRPYVMPEAGANGRRCFSAQPRARDAQRAPPAVRQSNSQLARVAHTPPVTRGVNSEACTGRVLPDSRSRAASGVASG